MVGSLSLLFLFLLPDRLGTDREDHMREYGGSIIAIPSSVSICRVHDSQGYFEIAFAL